MRWNGDVETKFYLARYEQAAEWNSSVVPLMKTPAERPRDAPHSFGWTNLQGRK